MTDQPSLPYHLIPKLADLLTAVPDDSILSRTIYRDEQLNVILFGFAAGQTLSEHTAAVPAVIHILSGEALIGLGDTRHEAGPGTWLHMDARLPHSILARTPLTMLLIMLMTGPTATA